MTHPAREPADADPSSTLPTRPTQPRVRDLEELDRRHREEARRHEIRARWFGAAIKALIIGLVGATGIGWWDLNTRLNRATHDLSQMREIVMLQTNTCRRYLPGDRVAPATEAKLAAAEFDLTSRDVATKLRGLREYRLISRTVCIRADRIARTSSPRLYSNLAAHTRESTGQIRKRARLYNQHARDYNLAAKSLPASLARPLFRFPASLPYIPSAD